MTAQIIELSEMKPHRTAEVVCLKCLHRYYAVWPEGVPLKNLECERCGTGYIILTGQELINNDKHKS
jgi:hypothetical protein